MAALDKLLDEYQYLAAKQGIPEDQIERDLAYISRAPGMAGKIERAESYIRRLKTT